MKRNNMPRHILAMFLCVMMLVSCFTINANALSLELDEGDEQHDISYVLELEDKEDDDKVTDDNTGDNNNVTWLSVYVDDDKVKNVDVFIDDDDDIYVSSYKDVKRIFPDETKDMFFPEEKEATPLSYWADNFGYYLSRSGRKVYLTSGKPSSVQIPTLDKEDDDSIIISDDPAVKVYVNGKKVANPGTYLDDYGNVRLYNPRSMYNIMPTETSDKNISPYGNNYLKVWADYFKYSYAQRGLRVYLSNNSFTPLEIHLGWDIIDFPDQQPYVTNGRTMVPVANMAETFGWTATYNNRKVTITNGKSTMTLFIDSKTYLVDGKEKALDVPAQIVNGRTMVPIAFVADAFGYTAKYDGTGEVKVVTLTKK